MNRLKHFIKIDKHSHNRQGRYKTKKEAEEIGDSMGLTAWQHIDGSWDLE